MRQHPPLHAGDHLRQGSFQNQTFEESIPRWAAGDQIVFGGSGIAHATPIPLQAGEIINNITFSTAGIGAVIPLSGFAALYSSDETPQLLAQTPDFGTTARNANLVFTVTLESEVLIERVGLYWVAICFEATTPPSLRGKSLGNSALAGVLRPGMPPAAQEFGSSLTGTAPATITGGSPVPSPCYYLLD